jgi:hypothetical protein
MACWYNILDGGKFFMVRARETPTTRRLHAAVLMVCLHALVQMHGLRALAKSERSESTLNTLQTLNNDFWKSAFAYAANPIAQPLKPS